MSELQTYRRRRVDDLIPSLLRELPTLLLTGPRATGKTTTAIQYARSVVRLDHEAEAAAFRADPDAALRKFAFELPSDPPDLPAYIELALRGGFPEPALRLSGTAREHWLESYVEQLLTRDVEQLAGRRDPVRVARFFEAAALNSAGVVLDGTLCERAGVNRKTALAYSQVLQNLLVLELMPAWASNRLKRLVRLPKRYLTDPALIGAALRIDAKGVLRDGDLLSRLLDTFVAEGLPRRPSSRERCSTRVRLHTN